MSERKGTKALELWCKRLVKDCPDVQIENMTTSWRDGIAFCALVHHFRPDLIEMSKLKPENIYENNQLAFSVAEKHLGIPALLDAEDMVENDVPDRLSILTYLSQFYQRLGHTVNTKVAENESKPSLSQATSTQPMAPISFGKTGLDKCTACGLPVYLAQRLLVSHKLYHRRCFRCSKCSGHLNPKNYHIIEGSEFCCDSCKNEKTLSKFLNNNDHDQMGMLAFSDMRDTALDKSREETVGPLKKSKPLSILEKISMFEKNIEKDTSVGSQIMNLTINDNVTIRDKEISSTSGTQIESDLNKVLTEDNSLTQIENEVNINKDPPEKQYKSNIEKFNFMQTQLTGSDIEVSQHLDSVTESDMKLDSEVCTSNGATDTVHIDLTEIDISGNVLKTESNITDDSRLAKSNNTTTDEQASPQESTQNNEEEIKICVPPRRKKNASQNRLKNNENINKPKKEYPDYLNPFSDDDVEEEHEHKEAPKKLSTNPFGSSDEEDDEVPPIPTASKLTSHEITTPVKRLIAVNPFWSDGEEPSSDEETFSSSKMYKSPITSSTPNLPAGTPRRKKAKAPPPPVTTHSASPRFDRLDPATSMDDVASISSLSSYNSTMHSDQKSVGRATPLLKKRVAPTPDSVSTVSAEGSLDKNVDTSPLTHNSLEGRRKGPAPGLPLPSRRLVRAALPPEQLQVQLDLLETQQLGLERQGVLIERIIRDKCEGDEANSVPQEEVEDLVIQLCELVNEKNDLFRKQTELMYIRRQQRLEQEQADIEHEIRIIQSRPTVNRIDADKAREEQLVSRLVEIVRMRDELVQQLDAERRRERQEDIAIAASIANKRAQRNSESNSSSIKSVEATPKKSKVKDKVKKQLKKAKHTLIPKKKEDTADRKEEKPDKDKLSK